MDVLFEFPNTTQALNDYANFLVNEYKSELELHNHRSSGKLISSISSIITIGENSAEVSLSMEDYYKYLEKERLKGSMPPIDSILEWIRTKPILPRPDENGRIPREEQLAWAIAKNMEKNGAPTEDGLPVPPTKDLGTAVEKTDMMFWGIIEEALVKDLEAMLKSSISILIV